MVFFHLRPLETPSVPPENRYTVTRVAIPNCYRLVVRHGYVYFPIYLSLAQCLTRSGNCQVCFLNISHARVNSTFLLLRCSTSCPRLKVLTFQVSNEVLDNGIATPSKLLGLSDS